VTWSCSTRGCTRPRSPYDRRCRPCATAAQAAYRARHRTELQAREQQRIFSPEQQTLRRARSYLAVYLQRGKLRPDPCELCGDRAVRPAWNDPRQPLAVRWFCHTHYGEHVELQREVGSDTTAVARDFAALRAAIATLPQPEQARLHQLALRGLDGTGTEPGSLRYWIALRRAHAKEEQAQQTFRV